MTLLVIANLTNVMANFAGVASALELFHVSRYISVPLAAAAVWLLVVKGTYHSVEKIFLGAVRHLHRLHHRRRPDQPGLGGLGAGQRPAGVHGRHACT